MSLFFTKVYSFIKVAILLFKIGLFEAIILRTNPVVKQQRQEGIKWNKSDWKKRRDCSSWVLKVQVEDVYNRVQEKIHKWLNQKTDDEVEEHNLVHSLKNSFSPSTVRILMSEVNWNTKKQIDPKYPD